MITHKLLWRQIWWALSLSVYDFIIIYQKETLNSADDFLWRLNHQCEVKQKNKQENTSVLHWVLFSTVTLISVKPKDDLLTQDLTLYETLIAETTSSNQWDWKKQVCEAVLEEELYEDIEISLIKILLKFLRVNSLMKHMFNKIAACEMHSKSLNNHSLWSWRENLLYFDQMLYISYAETLQISIILKHHNDSLAEHFVTEKTFALIRVKYYWLNMWKQIQKYCNTCIIC